MKAIKIIDMTLRETTALREGALSFREKLEAARSLDRLRVDAIELPVIEGGKADQLSNKTIAGLVATAVSATVGVGSDNVAETWESVRGARRPYLNVVAPVSPVQMEYIAHKKAAPMLEAIAKQVALCRSFSETVEFTAQDATRAESAFLFRALETALRAGASRLTVCDSAGVMLPGEFADFISRIRAEVDGAESAEIYVQTSDEMHMAAVCAAAAVAAGADGVKCTAVPAGAPTLEQVARFVEVKGAALDVYTGLRTTELGRVVGQMSRMLNTARSDQSPFDSGVADDLANVCLDQNDEMDEVVKAVRQLGYELTDEDNAKVYEAFKSVAGSKHFVGTRELDAIVATTAMQVPSAYRIGSYVINSGNVITATANITLEKDGEKLRSVAIGDGPVDAAFLAIEQIIGHHYELDDFQIQTVTEGREAMGSALVKLRADGKLYSGNGISTDIIGASIRAYISALNKIVYEQA